MKIKHDIIGDIMFYFSFKIFLYLLIILVVYYVFNKKAITVLEFIILLFIFNITLFSLYNNLKLIQTFIFVIITLAIYYLYLFCEEKKINKVNKNVLINRGIINFNALIEE